MLPCAIVERIIAIIMEYNVFHIFQKRDNDLLSLLESYRFDYGGYIDNQTNEWWLRKSNCIKMSIE